MFRSLSITGFRGFSKLKVDDLARFSLFFGRNNAGKTALLESIFMLAGPTNPELSIRVNSFRGVDLFRNDPEELWGWLFHQKNLRGTIELEAETATSKRTVTLTLKDPAKVQLKVSKQKQKARRSTLTSSTDSAVSELDIKYREGNHTTQSSAIVAETGVTFKRGRQFKFPTSIFVMSRAAYASENAERFSKLEESGEHEELLDPLRIIEPRLQRLSVLVTTSGPVIHGDIGIGRMVPLPYMGEGIGRLMTLLLSIITSRNGIIMIDEIETGLHYSVMSSVWSAIAKAARKVDAQVFATTHSWESFRAAHDCFSKSEIYDFRAHRLDRTGDKVTSTTYDKEMIETALTQGVEIR